MLLWLLLLGWLELMALKAEALRWPCKTGRCMQQSRQGAATSSRADTKTKTETSATPTRAEMASSTWDTCMGQGRHRVEVRGWQTK